MTLKIAKIPFLMFADNPAEVVFKKTGILADESGYARQYIAFDEASPPLTGETLKFDVNGVANAIVFNFTGRTSAKDTLDFYSAGDFGDYIAEIAKDIYRHPAIRADYYVNFLTAGSAGPLQVVEIVARRRGKDYTIELNGGSTCYFEPTASSAVNYADDDAGLENYKLKVRAVVGMDTYESKFTDIDNIEATGVLNPDTNEMEITIRELPAVSKAMLGFDIPFNAFKILACRYSNCHIYIEVEESYEGVNQKSLIESFFDLSATDERIVCLNGGTDLERSDVLLSSFYYFLGDPLRFLSLQPGREKIVTAEQPEWLHISPSEAGTYDIEFTVYYSDGTTDSKTVSHNNINSYVMIVPSGFDQNELGDLQPAKTAIKWTAACTYPDTTVSETFTYVIDQRYFSDNRYFIYRNSLGLVDTLRCVGVQKYSIKRKGESTTRTIDSNTRVSHGSIEMIYNELSKEWTMRTGWLLSKEEKEFMTEILATDYLAEVPMPLIEPVDLGGGRIVHYRQPYRSFIVLQDSVDMWQEDDGVFGFEWKMKLAHDDVRYSNIPVAAEPWYDNIVEVTVEITALGGNNRLYLTLDADGWAAAKVNGEEADFDLGYFTFTETGVYHFRFEVDTMLEWGLRLDGPDGVVTITKIESNSLERIELLYWDEVKQDYLVNRLRTLYTLKNLVIWMNADIGLPIDEMLASLAALWNGRVSYLEEVDFTFNTPGAVGVEIADYLNAEGVLVTTL